MVTYLVHLTWVHLLLTEELKISRLKFLPDPLSPSYKTHKNLGINTPKTIKSHKELFFKYVKLPLA